MNLGDSVHGASPDHDKHARSPRTQETLQDIQDIIDRLAAVTRQLGHPGRRVPGTGYLVPGCGRTCRIRSR
jgi:hypothetical protein